MPLIETNEDGSSQRGMIVFLAELQECSSTDGMFYTRSCSHSNSELFGRLFDEGIGEGRQLDQSGENGEII